MPRYISINVPPGGFNYTIPETGFLIKGASLQWVIANSRNYYKGNKMDIPFDLEDKIHTSICEKIRIKNPNLCTWNDEPPMLQRAASFAKAMIEWGREGFPKVSEETYLDRRRICEGDPNTPQCPYWNGAGYLTLGKCGKCGCSGLKLHLEGVKCPDGKW